MTVLVNAATALLALGGLVLTLLAFVGWRRSGQGRLGVLALGFALFAAAGAWTAAGLFAGQDAVALLTAQTLFVASALFVIYLAAVKR